MHRKTSAFFCHFIQFLITFPNHFHGEITWLSSHAIPLILCGSKTTIADKIKTSRSSMLAKGILFLFWVAELNSTLNDLRILFLSIFLLLLISLHSNCSCQRFIRNYFVTSFDFGVNILCLPFWLTVIELYDMWREIGNLQLLNQTAQSDWIWPVYDTGVWIAR